VRAVVTRPAAANGLSSGPCRALLINLPRMKPQGSPRLSALKQLRDGGGELLTDCQFKCWLVAGFVWNLLEVPNFRDHESFVLVQWRRKSLWPPGWPPFSATNSATPKPSINIIILYRWLIFGKPALVRGILVWLTIKLLYITRYATPLSAFRRWVGYNRKAVLLAVNLGHRLLRRYCIIEGLVLLPSKYRICYLRNNYIWTSASCD
jgi:hypothetical protein